MPGYGVMPAAPRRSIGSALVAIVGAVVAAGLFVSVPADESGRVVEARPRADRAIEVRHVAGRQYLAAYRDIVGIWTICDGLTRDVRAGMVETPDGCLIRLERELVEHATRIRACTPQLFATGREQQLHAAISLSYNIGWPSFCASTAAHRFRAGQWAAGCDAFAMWKKAGRPLRVVPGLVNRRRREIRICKAGLP
ncbi:lysozyme [Sphingomonas sp. IW22]|uniref:lysozyme n=1 Tax=Sphingomonas sp. IW22 TaxID=3242489 RepID=UPI0035227D6A